MKSLLIYGAGGFTGRQIVEKSVERGVAPIVAGRNAVEIEALGRRLGLQHRCFPLSDVRALHEGLVGVDVVLHCAGPFRTTARPMLDACLALGVDYLDIVGEWDVMEAIAERDAEIRAAGIMAMCGVGGDVVPTDCMAAHVKRRLPSATSLVFHLRGLERLSSGTVGSFIEGMGLPNVVRRAGVLVPDPDDDVRTVRFADRSVRLTGLPWADIVSAWRTTGIPDIKVYMSLWTGAIPMIRLSRRFPALCQSRPVQAFLKRQAKRWIKGPDERFRATHANECIVEATDPAGRTVRSFLRFREAYAFTAVAAAEISRLVLSGRRAAGYQTPAGLFGADFILGIEGSERSDL